MKNNLVIGIVLIAIAAGAAWYVSRSQQTASQTPEMMTTEDSLRMPVTESTGSTGAMMDEKTVTREVTVEGMELKFTPASLTFKKGETIKLTFKNVGQMPHDWVVDELGVRTKVIAGGSDNSIEFTPMEAGTFEYYCSVGQHRENGMFGTLTVTE